MLDYEFKITLIAVLEKKGVFLDQLARIFDNAAKLILNEYKKQVPVNKGFGRRSVEILKTDILQRVVKPTVTENGFNYLEAVHEGTGIYIGSQLDFNFDNISAGFTRENYYTEEELILFKVLRKRGLVLSIPPNKFADRTRKNTETRVVNYTKKQIAKILQ